MAYNKYKVNSNLESGMKVKVNNTRGHEIIIDEPESMNGSDEGMNPVEITLASLAGCLSITAAFLAKKMKVEIDDLSIDVEGEIDKEAMTSTEVDSGFKEIRYNIKIKSESSEEKIEKLIQSIGDYCPVSDTLIRAIDLTSSPPVPIVTNGDSLKKLAPKLSYVLRNDSFGIRPSRPSRGCRMIRGQSISSSPI